MKRALVKDAVKEIKNTRKRFLSILVMAFLGVGFFAGIRATSPDMLNAIDRYFKEKNVYDIEVVSTLGLTNEDVEEIKKVEGVKEVYPTYTKDCLVNIDESEDVVKLMCIEDVNQTDLVQGKLPEKEAECVVEESFLKLNKKNIGDKIVVNVEKQTKDNGDEIDYLKQNELTIVGVVRSTLYISRERGTSKLGSGEVDYYVYINKSNINATDVFTEIYVTTLDGNKYVTSSEDYKDYIKSVKDNIDEIKKERELKRYNSVVGNATNRVNDAQKTLDDEKKNAEDKIKEAEQELENAKNEITSGEKELSENKIKAENEFKDAESKIKSAKADIQNGENELQISQIEFEEKSAELLNTKAELENQLGSVESGISQINNQIAQIDEVLKNPLLSPTERAYLEQTRVVLIEQLSSLNSSKQQLENGIYQIEEGLRSGSEQLRSARLQLDNGKAEIEYQEQVLSDARETANIQFEDAQAKIDDAKIKVQDGEKELTDKKQEFNEKITDAQAKLDDAKKDIESIKKAEWYVLDREANAGYVGFIQDTESIKSVGVVFPIVFFVIATLISLTSMTRMVEEQRTLIGTLKALGYNKFQISEKYVIYASLACIIGGIIGMSVGFATLPRIIWSMYSMMYTIPNFLADFNVEIGLVGLGAACVCIIGATIYAVIKELVHTPAVLMRPKAPKNGKRVALERVAFVWKRLSFTRKVTVRNIFRYKKRFLMTIIGIFGCTSLIIAGFGLKDSISSLLPQQFGKIFVYDMQITVKSDLTDEQHNKLLSYLNSKSEINDIVETNIKAVDATKGDKKESIQMIIPKDKEELKKVINLVDVETEEKVEIDDETIVITDKLSQLLNVQKGDIITLKEDGEENVEVKISNIVKNNVSHYVYMSKTMYEKLYEKYETNVIYTNNQEISEEQENSLIKEIMSKDEVSTVSTVSSIKKGLDDTLSSLNYVVIILIASAGLLAFVVLYNLANVNISERIRELATIKVLGFYDKEVYNYVTRETVLLTAIGIILGCFGGYFLNLFILSTCEINILRFPKIVETASYIYSILITIGFTVIVNIFTYFSLKKIDMIESLKSVE